MVNSKRKVCLDARFCYPELEFSELKRCPLLFLCRLHFQQSLFFLLGARRFFGLFFFLAQTARLVTPFCLCRLLLAQSVGMSWR